MEALQRHEYETAAGRFRALLEGHPTERALLDRARVYLALCERALSERPVEPRTVEERRTAATAALNSGHDARAESLARGVLAEDPHDDMALYLLAAIEVRRGALEKAISYLSQAIAISPEARAQARHEADFEPLRGLEAFKELTDPPPPSAAPGGSRRARRPR
jgi:tetratricopeptide (TPR) repeat protein